MFNTRSSKLERIDTGDYTAEEYDRFLEDIRLVNRFAGDTRALSKTLLQDVENLGLDKFSVLDIGAGSGELLRTVGRFARKKNKAVKLCGLELNARSARAICEESKDFAEIVSVQGDARRLPFVDNSFDYAICSLFTHHLTNENIVDVLVEMRRVARRGVFVIDLHRHPFAWFFYKIFCMAFRISPLVREDGSLSILRGFKPAELQTLAVQAELEEFEIKRFFPFRLVLHGVQSDLTNYESQIVSR